MPNELGMIRQKHNYSKIASIAVNMRTIQHNSKNNVVTASNKARRFPILVTRGGVWVPPYQNLPSPLTISKGEDPYVGLLGLESWPFSQGYDPSHHTEWVPFRTLIHPASSAQILRLTDLVAPFPLRAIHWPPSLTPTPKATKIQFVRKFYSGGPSSNIYIGSQKQAD